MDNLLIISISSGKEQRAIVEYVLFPKTPKKSKRADPRENTIEAGYL